VGDEAVLEPWAPERKPRPRRERDARAYREPCIERAIEVVACDEHASPTLQRERRGGARFRDYAEVRRSERHTHWRARLRLLDSARIGERAPLPGAEQEQPEQRRRA